MVRDLIGPIAAFKQAAAIRALPRTRSGKTARKSIANLARNKFVKVSDSTYVHNPMLSDVNFMQVKLVKGQTIVQLNENYDRSPTVSCRSAQIRNFLVLKKSNCDMTR